jgi:hypothetical protein
MCSLCKKPLGDDPGVGPKGSLCRHCLTKWRGVAPQAAELAPARMSGEIRALRAELRRAKNHNPEVPPPAPKFGLDSFDLEHPTSDTSSIQFIVSRRKSDRADVLPLVGAFPRGALRPPGPLVPRGRALSRGHMLGSAPAILQPMRPQTSQLETFGAHGSDWTIGGKSVAMNEWVMPDPMSRNGWKNRFSPAESILNR